MQRTICTESNKSETSHITVLEFYNLLMYFNNTHVLITIFAVNDKDKAQRHQITNQNILHATTSKESNK